MGAAAKSISSPKAITDTEPLIEIRPVTSFTRNAFGELDEEEEAQMMCYNAMEIDGDCSPVEINLLTCALLLFPLSTKDWILTG